MRGENNSTGINTRPQLLRGAGLQYTVVLVSLNYNMYIDGNYVNDVILPEKRT